MVLEEKAPKANGKSHLDAGFCYSRFRPLVACKILQLERPGKQTLALLTNCIAPCTLTSCLLTLLGNAKSETPPFQASGHYPPTRGLTYTVLPSRVKNLAQYRVAVKELCRAVPAYFAQ